MLRLFDKQDPPLPAGQRRRAAAILLIFETGRGEFGGVEASFGRMLGEETGRPVRFLPMRFDRMIPRSSAAGSISS
jgi:hypothetical protein